MAILEICANSLQSALNAERGGAHRIELCQNLEAGGLTPSPGLITVVRQRLKIPVYVLIRPRTGDFVYTDDEFQVMLEDVRACRAMGCEGIAVGVLTPNACVDRHRLEFLVQAAKPMGVTFHRAFDDCQDMPQALEDVICAGCERILTSGGADSALEGSSMVAALVEKARGRIFIMPGAGITAQNIRVLADATNAIEYHASAKVTVECAVNSKFRAAQWETNLEQVKALAGIVNNLEYAQQMYVSNG